MPYFTTSDEWQRQSTLLLQARPTTTRITTKYHIPNLASPRHEKKLASRSQKSRDASAAAAARTQGADATAPKVARAYLELKTYDPESGTVLKYKTDKAAEVGRLIGGLGRLGRPMAGLEVKEEDVEMKEAAPAAEASGTATPQAEAGQPIGEASAVQQKAQQNASGTGGGQNKKKKKGKR